MERRLFRSRTNYMIGGVCGGLGAYFGVDPSIVRIIFVLLLIFGGSGFPIYLILWIILPREDRLADSSSTLTGDEFGNRARLMGDEMRDAFTGPNPRGLTWLGVTLVLVGAVLLVRYLFPTLVFLNDATIWAVLLILGGIFLLTQAMRR